MYYFVYSKQQYDKQDKSYSKIGKMYIPGKVAKNGKMEEYTSITQDIKSTQTLFGDAKVIAMVESLADIKYTRATFNTANRR